MAAVGASLATDPTHPTDPLCLVARRRRGLAWTVGLTAVLVVSVLVGVGAGSVRVGPATVARIIGHHLLGGSGPTDWPATSDAIVWQVRLPRVVLGVVVGAGLSVCGVVLQAMVRNVLADPYLLGINSGASSGAAAAILFGVGAGLGEHALQGSAFIGALLASLVVFVVAHAGGRVT